MSDSTSKAPQHQPVRKRTATSGYATRNAWMIGITFLCLILFFIIGRISYGSYQSALFAKAYQYSVPALNQAGIALTAKLKGYEDLSMQFLSNRDLNNMLARYVSSPDKYDVSRFNQAFANFLDGYAFNDSCLYEALFIDESSSPHKTLTMGEALPNDSIRSIRESRSFRAILAADGQPVWLTLEDGAAGSGSRLALGRRIKQLFTGRPMGVLILLLNERNLDYFINAAQYNDESFTRRKMAADYFLLTGPDGRVISAPFKEQIGIPVAHVIGNRMPLGWLSSGRRSGRFIHGVGDDQVLVTYLAVGPGKLYLLNVVTSSSARRINNGSMAEIHDPVPALLFAAILLVAALVLLLSRPRPAQSGRSGAAPAARLAESSTVAPLPAHKASPAWMAELTNREREILSLLAQGLDNKQIARQLFMAEQTVKNYVSVIYGKLGVHDRVQASLKAIDAGLSHPANESPDRDKT